MKFRRKTVAIEARRFTGEFDSDLIVRWMGLSATAYMAKGADQPKLAIPTRLGSLDAWPGDWVIEAEGGQFYPCKPEAFAASFELVEDE